MLPRLFECTICTFWNGDRCSKTTLSMSYSRMRSSVRTFEISCVLITWIERLWWKQHTMIAGSVDVWCAQQNIKMNRFNIGNEPKKQLMKPTWSRKVPVDGTAHQRRIGVTTCFQALLQRVAQFPVQLYVYRTVTNVPCVFVFVVQQITQRTTHRSREQREKKQKHRQKKPNK